MKKQLALFALIVGLCIFVTSVSAETVFNEMAKSISGIGKCGAPCAQKDTSVQAPAATCAAKQCSMDCMGNKVPTETRNTGKITL